MPITVNKIGGKNMSQLDKVGKLVDALKDRGESLVLVVSAFTGVTNKLIAAMDTLNGNDYSEKDIEEAFSPVKKVHEEILNDFFDAELSPKGLKLYEQEFEKLKAKLITHKAVSNFLMPQESSFGIRDQVIGFGEKMASLFLEFYLNNAKAYQDVQIDRDDLEIDRDDQDNESVTVSEIYSVSQQSVSQLHLAMQKALAKKLAAEGEAQFTRMKMVRILGGHIGNTPRGIAIDVGRSYTDTTAVNVALALQMNKEPVEAVRFWKDVPGVLTANPKDLNDESKAIVHSDVTMGEATEMAAAGSQLMQLDALSLAQQHELDLELRDIRNPENGKGTIFSNTHIETKHAFKSIISNAHVDTFTIVIPEMANRKGFGEAILGTLSKHGVSLDGFFTEGTSVTFSVPLPQDESDREEYRNKIRAATRELKTIEVDGEIFAVADRRWTKDALACISIIGNELSNTTGILSEITGVLGAYGINIKSISHGENQLRIMLLIDKDHRQKAVQMLHSIFVDGDEEVIEEYTRRRMARLAELTTTFK